jgi:cytochrome P450
VRRILGKRSILELSGADHKRICGALAEFLKPDMLRMYVGRIDGEVRRHVEDSWAGRRAVTVMPLMKRLTFDIISSLLFGLERGAVRDSLAEDFARVMEGMWSVPVNLKASARARRVLERITRDKMQRARSSNEPTTSSRACSA